MSRRELSLDPFYAMELSQLTALVKLYEGLTVGDAEAQRTVAGILSESRRAAREGAAQAREKGSSATSELGYENHRGVALVSFAGIVSKNPSCLGSLFGGDAVTSELIRTMATVTKDHEVKQTYIRMDTPGGSVDGTEPAAEAVWRARQVKPVTVFIDGIGASAGWWIASQATRKIGTPTSTTGSQGVYAAITDSSKAFEQKGVKVHLVKSAAAKGGGAAGVPVSDAVLAVAQREVDGYASVFNEAVARGCGISLERSLAMADGEPHTGRAALDLGYLDALAQYEDILSELVADSNQPTRFFLGNSLPAASAERTVPPSPTARKESSVNHDEICGLLGLPPETSEADALAAYAEHKKALAEARAAKAAAPAAPPAEPEPTPAPAPVREEHAGSRADAPDEEAITAAAARIREEITAKAQHDIFDKELHAAEKAGHIVGGSKGIEAVRKSWHKAFENDPDFAREQLAALLPVGPGKRWLDTNATGGSQSFKGQDWRDPNVEVGLMSAAKALSEKKGITVSAAIVELCA